MNLGNVTGQALIIESIKLLPTGRLLGVRRPGAALVARGARWGARLLVS